MSMVGSVVDRAPECLDAALATPATGGAVDKTSATPVNAAWDPRRLGQPDPWHALRRAARALPRLLHNGGRRRPERDRTRPDLDRILHGLGGVRMNDERTLTLIVADEGLTPPPSDAKD